MSHPRSEAFPPRTTAMPYASALGHYYNTDAEVDRFCYLPPPPTCRLA